MKKQLQTILGTAGLVTLMAGCTHRDATLTKSVSSDVPVSNSASNSGATTTTTTDTAASPATDSNVASGANSGSGMTATSGTTSETTDSDAVAAQSTSKSVSKKTSHSAKNKITGGVSAKVMPSAADRDLREGTVGSGTGSGIHSTVSKGVDDNDSGRQ